MSKVRASDGATLAVLTSGNGPGAPIFDGEHVWVAISTDGTVAKIRPSDATILGTFGLGAQNPAGMAFDGTHVWVSCFTADAVAKIRIADDQVVRTFPTDDEPIGLVFDGADLWVVSQGAGSVMKK